MVLLHEMTTEDTKQKRSWPFGVLQGFPQIIVIGAVPLPRFPDVALPFPCLPGPLDPVQGRTRVLAILVQLGRSSGWGLSFS